MLRQLLLLSPLLLRFLLLLRLLPKMWGPNTAFASASLQPQKQQQQQQVISIVVVEMHFVKQTSCSMTLFRSSFV